MARNAAEKATSRQRHHSRPIEVLSRPERDNSLSNHASSSSSLAQLSIKKSIIVTGEDTQPRTRKGTYVAKTNLERSMLMLPSIAILSVNPLPTTHNHNKFTLYAIHVQNATTGRSWLVYRRFSDFRKFRALLLTHLSTLRPDFPILLQWIKELYFPRKLNLWSKSQQVVQHRAKSLLAFCQKVLAVLVRSDYFQRKLLNETGLSILRGFLGSTSVCNCAHYDYAYPVAVPQYMILPSQRVPVGRCGNLTTVMEESIDERWVAKHEEDLEDVEDNHRNRTSDTAITCGKSWGDETDDCNSATTEESSSSCLSLEDDQPGDMHDKQYPMVNDPQFYVPDHDDRGPVMQCVEFEESEFIIL